MSKLRIGYLYSLSPIHCGGEGDLGNILEIAREVHTNFPYVPASSLRGSVRDEVINAEPNGKAIADRLFGKELDDRGQMGVHQVWFGDARLLWVPMRTMAIKGNGRDVFTWVSCHSLIRDHSLLSHRNFATFPDHAVGNNAGTYLVADAEIIGRWERHLTELSGVAQAAVVKRKLQMDIPRIHAWDLLPPRSRWLLLR